MAQRPFGTLHRRLLAGGIAPRRARRLIAELRGHYEDLLAEQGHLDLSAGARARAALERLGNEELLAHRLLAQRHLLSWSRRWPWAIYGIAPLLLYPLALAACCALIVALGTLGHRFPPSSTGICLQMLTSLRFFSLYLLPALMSAGTLWVALQRRVAFGWVALSIVLLACFGSLTNVDVSLHAVRAGIGVSSRLPLVMRLLLTRCIPTALGGGLLAALWRLCVLTHQRAIGRVSA